jgi:UPF0755 protein
MQTTIEPTGPAPSDGPRWRRAVRIGAAVIIGGAMLVLAATLLAGAIRGPSPLDVEPGISVEVTVEPGASARVIAATVEQAGIVSARELADEIARRSAESQLKAGAYSFETGMEAVDVVDQLLAGPNSAAAGSISVREGATVAEVIEQLAAQTGNPPSAFRDALLDGSVTSPYLPDTVPPGVDPLARWEGLLFPALYQSSPDATPAAILQHLADEMVDRVETMDWSRLDELGVSRYEALVVASLIEREAAAEEDRALIASVAYNRLAAGMPLQIDATVIYALGENPGRVSAEHLEIDSPYNTYRITGLPPTPIGTIRQTSLDAAADPAATGFLFYVLVSADGRHGFSETYEEHQDKIRQAREDGVLP